MGIGSEMADECERTGGCKKNDGYDWMRSITIHRSLLEWLM